MRNDEGVIVDANKEEAIRAWNRKDALASFFRWQCRNSCDTDVTVGERCTGWLIFFIFALKIFIVLRIKLYMVL